MNDATEALWVLLWSRDQGAVHIEPLSETLRTNLDMLYGELESNNYLVLFVGTRDEVGTAADTHRDAIRAKWETDEALGLHNEP